jgi:SpoVK/Ycf46/Vps4 family AAA+-type ATPase
VVYIVLMGQKRSSTKDIGTSSVHSVENCEALGGFKFQSKHACTPMRVFRYDHLIPMTTLFRAVASTNLRPYLRHPKHKTLLFLHLILSGADRRMKAENLIFVLIFCSAASATSTSRGTPGFASSKATFSSSIRSPLSKCAENSLYTNEKSNQRKRRRRGPWHFSSMDSSVLLAKGSGAISGPFKIDTSDDNHGSLGGDRRSAGRNGGIKTIELYPLLAWKSVSFHLRRVGRRLPRFFSRITSDSNQFLDRLAAGAKFAVFAVIGVELFFIVRDIFREAMNEYRDAMELEDTNPMFRGLINGNGSGQVLSTANLRKIILWLQEPNSELRSPPPNDVSPAWMVPIAEELRECKGLTLADIQQILTRLTKAEALMLQTCLLCSKSKVDFRDVGGLASVKATISKWLLSSLSDLKQSMPSLENNTASDDAASSFQKFISRNTGPRSMCLWGPPGCGKSLLLRAIAKHSGLPTLVITPSMLQRKWYGESTERVRNFFKLVNSLGSCVVVMDEMDGILMSRRDEDHEVTRELKTEWLQWWDGLAAETSMTPPATSEVPNARQKTVLFVAATNRPWDIDAGAWRRLGHRVYVGLPNADDRLDLVRKWLKDFSHVPYQVLQSTVQLTEGYLPSDMQNLLIWACQNGPIARQDANLEIGDIQAALRHVFPTQFSSHYVSQLQGFLWSHRQGSTSSSPPLSPGSNSAYPNSRNEVSNPLFSPSTASYDDGLLWQTPMGNFYQLQVPVDSFVFDAIQNYFWNSMSDQEDFFWSDWEDIDDFDDDTDTDDYDL